MVGSDFVSWLKENRRRLRNNNERSGVMPEFASQSSNNDDGQVCTHKFRQCCDATRAFKLARTTSVGAILPWVGHVSHIDHDCGDLHGLQNLHVISSDEQKVIRSPLFCSYAGHKLSGGCPLSAAIQCLDGYFAGSIRCGDFTGKRNSWNYLCLLLWRMPSRESTRPWNIGDGHSRLVVTEWPCRSAPPMQSDRHIHDRGRRVCMVCDGSVYVVLTRFNSCCETAHAVMGIHGDLVVWSLANMFGHSGH
jgi:hypothetical protein